MHQHGYYENKEQLLKRLRRAEGQVRGIAGMIEADKYCIDILAQVGAAQAALDKVALELVRDHSRHCMSDPGLSAEDRAAKADELVTAVGRLLSK